MTDQSITKIELETRERLVGVERGIEFLKEGQDDIKRLISELNGTKERDVIDLDNRVTKLEEHRGLILGGALAASTIMGIISGFGKDFFNAFKG